MPGSTITEKIIAAHSGKDMVKPGEIIMCAVDIALGNDVTAPLAIEAFASTGFTKVYDTKKIVLVPDHFAPNKDIKSAQQCKYMRDFAHTHNIETIQYFLRFQFSRGLHRGIPQIVHATDIDCVEMI